MIKYADRQGKEITALEWAALFENFDYRLVAKTTVGENEISTIWLGMNHGFNPEFPKYFETCVFDSDGSSVVQRYETEVQALKGHAEIVSETLKKIAYEKVVEKYNEKTKEN